MPNFYSLALTKVRAGRRASPRDVHGKFRILDFACVSIDAAENDVIALAKLPKGWKVLEGRIFHPAFGASVTVDVGTYLVAEDGITVGAVESVDRFLDGDDQAAAGTVDIAETLAKGALYVATADMFIAAKLLGANPAAGILQGYMIVVAD